jgi:predicted nucleic acid-binding Zn ribbon protein
MKEHENLCVCGKKIKKDSSFCIECYKKNRKPNRMSNQLQETEENFCICGKKIKRNSLLCTECHNKKNRKVERPSYEQLKKEVKESSYCAVGRKYGVSDNAIRKWIKYYEKNIVL